MYNRGSRQYSRVEGLELTSLLMKATKSKLTAEQSLTKSLEHMKKCILQPKTKEEKKTVAGGAFSI